MRNREEENTQELRNDFLSVIEAHKGIIYKISKAYSQDSESQKDLSQEIVLQLWRAFDRYDPQYKLSTWIYRIALNVSISNLRLGNRRISNSIPLDQQVFNIEAEKFDSEKEAQLQLLEQFIQELKELDRALMLLYLDGKSHHEISQILGISNSNVATKIGRIKIQLKAKFTKIHS